MTLGTDTTRVGQATQPGTLVDDAALTQQADRFDERPGGAGAMEHKKRGRFGGMLWLHLTLTTIAVLLSIPFVYLMMMSLKPFGELSDPTWLPKDPEFVYLTPRLPDNVDPETGYALRLEADEADEADAVATAANEPPGNDPTAIGETPAAADDDAGADPASATPGDVLAPAQAAADEAAADEAEAEGVAAATSGPRYREVSWLPFTLPIPANYYNVFDTTNPDLNNRGIPLHVYFRNSLFVACWVTFLQVVTSSMAAFSFARLKWPGRDKVFLLYLSTMMLPGLVMMIPNYQIMIQLGLVDTLPGLIIPAAFSAFGTFLLRQFMLTIPSSLDEAAEIDGASKFRLFWDIILPLTRPGLVTLTIFTFMGNYNSFFWPLVMLRTEERYTLPIGLLFFNSSRGQQTHLMMAAVMLSIIPMILIFVLLQKQLVKGIQLGAVKG